MRRRPTRSKPLPQRGASGDLRRPVEAALKGVPVLVVDPDGHSAGRTAAALASAGASVRVALDAEQAQTTLIGFRARVLLLDLVLPGVSGLVLAQRLAADEATAGLIIIGVSAFAGADAERMARQAGCAAHLRRPFDSSRLVELLAQQLRGDA